MPFSKVLAYLSSYSPQLTLSPSYISKIIQELSRAGLAIAIPGPRGGYRIARPAEKISLLDVVEAADGPLLSDCCLLSVGDCPWESTCGLRKVTRQAELALYRTLQKETVASLARRGGPSGSGPSGRRGKGAARTTRQRQASGQRRAPRGRKR